MSSQVNWDAVKVGDIVDVDLSASGLADARQGEEVLLKLLVRNACIDMLKFLKSSNADKMVHMVQGCPGIGKSVEVYSYAVWYATAKKQRLLYIHGDEDSGFHILFKDTSNSDEARYAHIPKFIEQPEVLLSFIEGLYHVDEVDMIVLDGALSWLIRKVYLKMDKHPSARLVVCTSFQAMEKCSNAVCGRRATKYTFTMDSWSEDEYDAAVKGKALKLPEGKQ